MEKVLKIMHADPTYPLNDPYNPSIGFNTRKADILNALNAAWPGKASSL